MKITHFIIMLTGMTAAGCTDKTPQLGKNSIDEVVNAMH